MDARTLTSRRCGRVWLSSESGSFDSFRAGVERVTDLAEWPFAAAVEKNVLIYDGESRALGFRRCRKPPRADGRMGRCIRHAGLV